MANIRVDVDHTISDGAEVLFYAPCDFADISGLKVYYPGPDAGIMSHEFTFQDAHKNDLSNLDNLFAEGACVKVILSVTNSVAHIQNADTNAYLEGKFDEKVNNTDIDQTLDANSTNPIANKAVAEELAKKFNNTGGTIRGDLLLSSSEAKQVEFRIKNAVRNLVFAVRSNGSLTFYDTTNNNGIIDSLVDGTNLFNGTASRNLPLTGGTIEANMANPLRIRRTDTDTLVRLQFEGKSGVLGSLGFLSTDKPMFLPSSGSGNKELLHTGNKPSGTYSGTGEATERTIDIGGIGGTLRVANSAFGLAFVTKDGACCITKTGFLIISKDECKYENGKLTIKTTSNLVNAGGYGYAYELL